MQNKFKKLKEYLKKQGKQGICLAFSGGIDSMVLLYLCKEADTRVVAVTFRSEFQSDAEIELTKKLCEKYNVRQIIAEYDILSNPVIVNNPKDRCYHCKKVIFSKMLKIADEYNLRYVLDGTNFDDIHEYRPGLRALNELNVMSPFVKYEITKAEIRVYAKEKNIEIFDKPSTPCLATRFPYNTKLYKEKLMQVESAEKFLKNNGFLNCRVRVHNDIARIEISKEKFIDFINLNDDIIKALKPLGFSYITLDIEGLRSGSMDLI